MRNWNAWPVPVTPGTRKKGTSSSMTPHESSTNAKRIYLDLRQRILDMTLLPGARIVERDIAAEHGTSRTPVHEAVQRLTEEGLIEVVQRVGSFVARIPLDQLEEAMLVRTALEVVIVEKAAARIQSKEKVRLKQLISIQQKCVAANDLIGFHKADEIFHQTLAEIAKLPGVWRVILQAKTQVDRYRRITLPIPGRMNGVVKEHAAVVEALVNGKVDKAVQAIRSHLNHVLPVVESVRSLRPEYFVNHLPD